MSKIKLALGLVAAAPGAVLMGAAIIVMASPTSQAGVIAYAVGHFLGTGVWVGF